MRRAAIALALAALCAAVLGAGAGAANECRGIPVCISVPGPWVAVSAHGEAQYLLECPRRRGVVGGLDAEATTRDVRVSFDARLGSPVAPGTTTGRDAFFRGVSAGGRVGAFKPYLGCIPAGGGGGRSTTSARIVHPGVPVERHAKTVKLARAGVQVVAQGCARGERLIGGWHALAFRTAQPPSLALVRLVKISHATRGGKIVARVATSEGLPASAQPEVQVGAVCAP